MHTRGPAGRSVVGVLAAVVGVALIYLSWGPLRNLFKEAPDGHPLVYVAIGALFLIPGVVLVIAATRIIRGSSST